MCIYPVHTYAMQTEPGEAATSAQGNEIDVQEETSLGLWKLYYHKSCCCFGKAVAQAASAVTGLCLSLLDQLGGDNLPGHGGRFNMKTKLW